MYDADKCLAKLVQFAKLIIQADEGTIQIESDPANEMALMTVALDERLAIGDGLPEQWARRDEKDAQKLRRFAMFSPDKCLDEIIRLSYLIIEAERKNLRLFAEPSNALAECFLSLNEWLEKGGQVPERWGKIVPQAAALHPAA